MAFEAHGHVVVIFIVAMLIVYTIFHTDIAHHNNKFSNSLQPVMVKVSFPGKIIREKTTNKRDIYQR